MLTDKLARVQDALGPDFGSKIAFVSITTDPEHDTPEVLKGYAEAFEANLAGWSFLTGEPAAVLDVAHRYGVAVAKAADGQVDHTMLTTLIDRQGAMRVQYLGYRFDEEEFRRDLRAWQTSLDAPAQSSGRPGLARARRACRPSCWSPFSRWSR